MLNVEGLRVRYAGQLHEAVSGVSFDVPRGAFVGLVGESGSGKTSIVMAALGLLPAGSAATGAIDFEGQNLLTLDEESLRRLRWKKIALVPQGAQNSFTPVKTVGAHIEEVLRVHLRLRGEAAKARAAALLTEAELDIAVARRYPHELSGGQKQRAAIALALACSPSLLLADEPTTALDVTIQEQVLHLIETLKKRFGTSLLLITHDLGVVAEVCDRVGIVYAGNIVEYGTLEHIYNHTSHPYTQGLFGSIPNFDKKVHRLKPIAGLMPDPANLPDGCVFAARCPEAKEACRRGAIPNVEIAPGHFVRCLNFACRGE